MIENILSLNMSSEFNSFTFENKNFQDKHNTNKHRGLKCTFHTIHLLLTLTLLTTCVILLHLHFSFLPLNLNKVDDNSLHPRSNSYILFGGNDDPDHLEIIHINNNNKIQNCLRKGQFFMQSTPYGAFGISMQNYITICGGSSHQGCFHIDDNYHSWSDNQLKVKELQYSALVPIQNSQSWWVTGGRLNHSATSTSMIINPYYGLSIGPQLPLELYGHCLVNIGKERYFMTTGITKNFKYARDTYIIKDLETFPKWYSQKDLNGRGREGAVCSFVQTKNRGSFVIVAGGYNDLDQSLDSTELFSLSKMSWSNGPKMLQPVHYGISIALSVDTFLLLGGKTNDEKLKSIYEFDVSNLRWRKRKEELIESRAYFASVYLPNKWKSCE